MDRVVLGGCFLLVALGVLLGLNFSAEQSIGKSVRDALELLSFVGTAVTGVVAVVALTSWRSQFRHTERFKALKDLKDASLDLYFFLAYLNSLANRHIELVGGGERAQELAVAEAEARERWHEALDIYRRAWGVAVVFLTPEEVKAFCGSIKVFNVRNLEDSLKIITSYSNSPPDTKLRDLLDAAAETTESVRALYEQTIIEIDQLLARHTAN